MSWCAWAIQNGHAEIAHQYMSFTQEAIDGSPGARLGIYPWQLETLVNEALVAPHMPNARRRKLRTEKFSDVFNLVKLVQRIEGADDRKFLASNDVLYELHRLTQRQFEWERGFTNQPRFYRALSMFGQGEVGAYFQNSVGCSVPEFIEAAFHLLCGSANSPTRRWKNYLGYEGVSASLRAHVLDRISTPIHRARAVARELRANGDHAAYKPSVLRRHPILLFGKDGEDAMAPIPPLILQRVTSGLYFDVVEGGGSLWNEIGEHFENYCLRYLGAMLDGHIVEPEFRYGPKGRTVDSPDVLIMRHGADRLVVECKAKRMSIEARFSGNPVLDAACGYEEIAKGVFQIWRYFSHSRRGVIDRPVAPDCLGMVVTADPWLIMGKKLHPEVIAIANKMADDKDPEISAIDRRGVPVILVDDLEYILQNGTVEELFLRLASLSQDVTGWGWSLVHDLEERPPRPSIYCGAKRTAAEDLRSRHGL